MVGPEWRSVCTASNPIPQMEAAQEGAGSTYRPEAPHAHAPKQPAYSLEDLRDDLGVEPEMVEALIPWLTLTAPPARAKVRE